MDKRLWHAVGQPKIAALVGGGGKTTLAYRLTADAIACGKCVLLTTTTRMRMPRTPDDIEQALISTELQDAVYQLRLAREKGLKKIALYCGIEESPHGKGKRAIGIPPEWPIALLRENLADVIVVEADGSRMLPFKAPRRPNEPVIPVGSNAVLAIAGIDCLDSQLVEEEVCRADVVAHLTEKQLGDKVTQEMVARIIGDKHLWCHSVENSSEIYFFAVVNKVDSEELLVKASEIYEIISSRQDLDVHSVLITGGGCGDVLQHHARLKENIT
eukprot:TRINITY_DN34940_c0_g1_i1.p1 TRINITY_DN34940_c0_g1~~TRINITY_DN34940_c0_g1_i1.p1  ORF type:complete len:272 (+),score=47.25 TRINITY_DN34940_c0_g1_i1:31-846(+)